VVVCTGPKLGAVNVANTTGRFPTSAAVFLPPLTPARINW
jgi:hypothetical protein